MGAVVKREVDNYSLLLDLVGTLLEKARKEVYYQINHILINTYWKIGEKIVEFEQQRKERAEYGSKLLDRLSQDLKLKPGKGFSKSNLVYMRLFYLKYPKSETLSHQLGWGNPDNWGVRG